ncbi:hypothetical protein JOM56_006273 [Amanita muscaria]
MVSPLLLSTTSANELQTHLYTAFLGRRTADVALRIRGAWCAVYNLHRVVLIQSGFFRSLFTAGFSEATPRLHSHQFGAEEIEVIFDDHNITRAAFEICIARLYGGGPQLYIPSSLMPSTTCPLSSSFFEGLSWSDRPEAHHPASPRFLLSLLATALYLSIPSIASQALSCILSTIGPYTAVQYLDFALGRHIGPPGEIDLEAAVGLEHVAQTHDRDESDLSDDALDEDDRVHEQLPQQMANLHIRKESPEASESDRSAGGRARSYYGAISDKIGEACACWLARWAPDMLTCEELLEGIVPSPSSEPSGIARAGNAFVKRIRTGPQGTPRIWRQGGLSARWVCALVSADTLFVHGELGRYDFARRVVELRRRGVIEKEDEIQWTNMFEHGIYYENMTMEDIVKLSQDTSPTTQQPFVPLRTLQSALWRQSVLRMRITSKSSVFSSDVSRAVPSTPTEKGLGIGLSTSELRSTPSTEEGDSQTYFPIPDDFSTRSGGLFNNKLPVTTMEELYEYLRSPSFSTRVSSPTGVNASLSSRPSNIKLPASESTFFGLLTPRCNRSTYLQCDPGGERKWTSFPPCRFSVEFWDLDHLKEKLRLHSQTVWYAGSLFNVYVQVMKKKRQVQLGIYLHRQSSIDPVPGASIPSPLLCQDVMDGSSLQDERHTRFHKNSFSAAVMTSRTPPTRQSSTSTRSMPDVSSLSSAPVSAGSSQSSSNHGVYSLPATGNPIAPRQPYRDPRSTISAYFTIRLASATGTSQSWFSSAPDEFAISQSWGWRTSSLRTEEFIEVRDDDAGPRTNLFGSEVSLRATVVLGFI